MIRLQCITSVTDKSVCTDGDKCDNGIWKSGTLDNCNDKNDDTDDDTCDVIQGCNNVPDRNNCNSEFTNSLCSARVFLLLPFFIEIANLMLILYIFHLNFNKPI